MEMLIEIPNFCMPFLNVNWHYLKIQTTLLHESTVIMMLTEKVAIKNLVFVMVNVNEKQLNKHLYKKCDIKFNNMLVKMINI